MLLPVLLAPACGDEGPWKPFVAPDFTATDLNHVSPTYGLQRQLSAELGKVMLLSFFGFNCGYCRAQFGELRKLRAIWRSEGLIPDELELWVMGRPSTTVQINEFSANSDVPCFIDGGGGDESVFRQYGASIDHLFLVDRSGVARHRFDLADDSLFDAGNRDRLDTLVRELLAE